MAAQLLAILDGHLAVLARLSHDLKLAAPVLRAGIAHPYEGKAEIFHGALDNLADTRLDHVRRFPFRPSGPKVSHINSAQ